MFVAWIGQSCRYQSDVNASVMKQARQEFCRQSIGRIISRRLDKYAIRAARNKETRSGQVWFCYQRRNDNVSLFRSARLEVRATGLIYKCELPLQRFDSIDTRCHRLSVYLRRMPRIFE